MKAAVARALRDFEVVEARTPGEARTLARERNLDAALIPSDSRSEDAQLSAKNLAEAAPWLPVLYVSDAPSSENTVRQEAGSRELARELLRACDGGTHAHRERLFAEGLAQLYVAWQPIVRLSDRSVLGQEALLRCDHPLLRNPLGFIDLALRVGKMDVLGLAVREAIAKSLATTTDPHLAFVNLHVTELAAEDLLRDDGPLTPFRERIVLEITERASLDDVKDASECAKALRAKGYRLAIDDLGAGYAGISAVAELEPDVCKLDMSVVRNVHLSRPRQRMIKALLQAANDLEMEFVIEGVETVEELECLRTLGCDVFQGYLFGRPARERLAPSWPPSSPV
ncbi:MAG: EAL domain-containing protein [Deltaproteobacteria bacterium]|nr:EAL domain-containing protein [Deltaproteobacteria bacterium]